MCPEYTDEEQNQPLKVLVVEDDRERQNVLRDLYRMQQVETSTSAEGALEKLASNVYHIIHLDYDLAEDSKGVEVARYVAGVDTRPTVITHSENKRGVEEIRDILGSATVLPMSYLAGKTTVSSKVKSLLSRPLSELDMETLQAQLDIISKEIGSSNG